MSIVYCQDCDMYVDTDVEDHFECLEQEHPEDTIDNDDFPQIKHSHKGG